MSSLYGPIFSRIDPEEVGSRSRAMRIGEDYGIRLNQRFKNLKADQLGTLSRSYSSHGFVIDMEEAKALFHRVREATPEEKSMVRRVGVDCRYPAREPTIKDLAEYFTDHSIEKSNPEPKDDEPQPDRSERTTGRQSKPDGGNSGGTGGPQCSEAGKNQPD